MGLCVEFLYLSVSRGRGVDGDSFNKESFGDFSEVRYHVKLGMWCFAQVSGILRNKSLPVLQEEGGPKRAKDSSASRVYESQSAFFRLMKVRWGGSGRFIWTELPSWIMIGRWSELRVVRVRHSESKAMWEVAIA